jgi:two-component system LytT family sensor kinase
VPPHWPSRKKARISLSLAAAKRKAKSSSTPLPGFGLAMVAGGLAGGVVHRMRPAWVLRPSTGFALGLSANMLRYTLAWGFSALFGLNGPPLSLGMEALTALINGAGVALILQVVVQVRARDESARAAAMAEVRALQVRMSPHFLFNTLNTIAALSAIDPRAVPGATSRLARFLRGSLEQHDRVTVPLREELEIVAAYLDVELLRMGGRHKVEQCVEAALLDAQIPPFLVQPLVENAVKHGIEPRDEGGRVRLEAWAEARWLHITVADTGVGLARELDQSPGRGPEDRTHALDLLRLRLAKLYNGSFSLEVRSDPGAGTTAAIRIPLEGCERLAVREVR